MIMLMFAASAFDEHDAAELARRAGPASEQLTRCAEEGCARPVGARAAWVLALHRYVDEGYADGELAATVRVLDPALYDALPDALLTVDGQAPAWTGRVGGVPFARAEPVGASQPVRSNTESDRSLHTDHYYASGEGHFLHLDRGTPEMDALDPSMRGHDRFIAAAAVDDGRSKRAAEAFAVLLIEGDLHPRVRDAAAIRIGRSFLARGQPEAAAAWFAHVHAGPLKPIADVERAVALWLEGDLHGAQRLLRKYKNDAVAKGVAALIAEVGEAGVGHPVAE